MDVRFDGFQFLVWNPRSVVHDLDVDPVLGPPFPRRPGGNRHPGDRVVVVDDGVVQEFPHCQPQPAVGLRVEGVGSIEVE